MSEADYAQPTTDDNNTANVSVAVTTTAPKNNTSDNKKNTGTATKKGSDAQGKDGKKPTKAQVQQSVKRKFWVDRIVLVILVAALIVYFIVLIISMVSSGNSTVVEKEETVSKINVPLQYLELYSETATSTTTGIDCLLEFYVGDEVKVGGQYTEKTFTQTTSTDGWEVLNLVEYAAGSEEYNYTGLLVVPPSDTEFKIDRNIKNYISFDCSETVNITVYVNLYYEGQYDQYESGAEEIDAISYDAYDSKMGFDTNFDLSWFTISDELQFASRPQALEGIEGAYHYYEMDLSGVYPLSGRQTSSRGTATYAGYRKQTKYVYQDATTFYDVVAAIGGMYTSLAGLIAWFTIKFLWGYEFKIYTYNIYKWPGFAPYAPKDAANKKNEKEEDGEDAGNDGGDDGLDM